jgi:hypothetical protein
VIAGQLARAATSSTVPKRSIGIFERVLARREDETSATTKKGHPPRRAMTAGDSFDFGAPPARGSASRSRRR